MANSLRAARFGLVAVCALGAGALWATEATAQAAPPPASYAQNEVQQPSPQRNADVQQDRIEALEAQLREATAQQEQLQYQLMQAQREIRRLQGIVGELAATNDDLVEGAAEPQSNGQAPPGPQSDARSRATGTLGTLPAGAVPASQNTAPAAPRPSPEEAFRSAQQLLLNSSIAEAENAFGQFVQNYPDAPQVADAQFWYAYTLLARNNYTDARAQFVSFLRAHPNHVRAAEAQVRLGMALNGLGDKRTACAAFQDLPRGSARAVRDLAAREARAAECAG